MGIMVCVRKKSSELPQRDLSFTSKAIELGSYMVMSKTFEVDK